MGAGRYTRERLEEAARGARTLSEALERLGADPRSPTRRYVRERMRKLGVDVSHFEREGVKWTREVLAEAVAGSWDAEAAAQPARHREAASASREA